MENIMYKEAHYAMWDDIAKQIKHSEANGDKLNSPHMYKALWVEEHGYKSDTILHNCFACAACAQNCNECPLQDLLKGCFDIWLNVVCKAFINNDYVTAYRWAIKIRDGWK